MEVLPYLASKKYIAMGDIKHLRHWSEKQRLLSAYLGFKFFKIANDINALASKEELDESFP